MSGAASTWRSRAPRCGEFDQPKNEWVLLVGTPEQAGRHRRSALERKRDDAGVGETAGDPVGRGGDRPPGGDDLEPLLGAGDVVVGAAVLAPLLIQRPEGAPVRTKVRATRKRLVKQSVIDSVSPMSSMRRTAWET